MVHLYKSKILSYIEFRTGAIYHASGVLLARVDNLQNTFLKTIGVSPENALTEFNLSPLSTRRDMALLGVIQRAIIGEVPVHFRTFFKRAACTGHRDRTRHSMQLATHRRGKFLDVLADSILGLVDVYNLLPERIVQENTVKGFQSALQEMVKAAMHANKPGWESLYSPRHALHSHQLKEWFHWKPEAVTTLGAMDGDSASTAANCITGWLQFGSAKYMNND